MTEEHDEGSSDGNDASGSRSSDGNDASSPSSPECTDTSDAPSLGGADAASTYCEQCGEPIETSEWYPITSDRDDDGSLQLHPFCTEDCQSAWLDERSE